MSNNKNCCKKSILDALSEHALEQPDRNAFVFLDDKIEKTDSYTFFELENASAGLAQHLLINCNLKENDRVLLVFLPDLSFVVSILACFKAGLIAVPVYPPDPTRGETKNSRHFMTIQNISEAKAALTHNTFNNFLSVGSIKNFFTWSSESNKISSLNWINVDKVIAESKLSKAKVVPASYKTPIDKVAFLQFTSGSTSDPKGVMVTHGNIEHNALLNGTFMMNGDKSGSGFMWVPHYHDMGLIGGYLSGTHKGSTSYVMSPLSFLKDPTLWVRGISKYKCNFTGGPNFAMSLSVRKFKEKEKTSKISLDLSCLKTIILGAELVDANAVMEFTKYFESAGLKPQTLSPAFGLAEHTLVVIAGGESIVYLDKKALLENQVMIKEKISRFSQDSNSVVVDPDTHPFVSCGMIEKKDQSLNVDLIIVDPESLERLEDGKIGEIWISSASKALGYYKNPKATEEVFHAKVKGPAASNYNNKTFLRTGDLAFVDCNELYFCGRIKDLIIFQGVNYYPDDIERTTEKCHACIRPGCTAAFSVKLDSEATESLVIFSEVRGGVNSLAYPKIIDAIVTSVLREQGIYVSTVCLLKERTIIKTSSGKVARAWNRKAFLEGKKNKELNIVSRWNSNDGEVPSNPKEKKNFTYEEIESIIVDIVREALRNPQAEVSVDTNLLEIGLASQDIPFIASKMSTELGYQFHPHFVYLYPTIKDVAQHAFSSLNGTGKTTAGSKQKEVFVEELDDLTIHPYEGHLAGYGTSFPIPIETELIIKKNEEIRRKLGQSEETIEYFRNVAKSSQIKTRHYCNQMYMKEGQSIEGLKGVVKENIFDENFDAPYHKRMSVFKETCVELCIDAARKALDNWGKDRKSISHILTTCTSGFEEPGIACGIIDQLNLSEDIQKAELNFNGCFCGATCLRIARDFIRSGHSQAVLVVACEVASTHLDFKSIDKQHLVSQSLFADGAAAFIVAREGTWRFTKTGSSVIPQTKHLLGLRPPMKEGENSYYMTLSPNVASSLGVYFSKGHGKDLLKKMYNPNIQLPGLAVHPGGPRILEAMGLVFKDLGFKDDALKSSYETFANNGNLGSAAMLLVLAERLSKNDIEEDRLLSMAFGPGVTVEWATYIRSSADRRGKKGENKSLFYVAAMTLVVAVVAVLLKILN